jgi:hypothetical protein
VGDSYADLFNALQRIETAAVFLPSFKITHEGGLEAVVQNIVDAISPRWQSRCRNSNLSTEKINEPHHLTGTLKPVTIHT